MQNLNNKKNPKRLKSFIVLILTVNLLVSGCSRQQEKKYAFPAIQSSMIWTSAEFGENGGYFVFRKSFELSEPGSPAQLQLFADSRYWLWINGQYVLRGPCRFNPKRPEYDIIDIQSYLKKERIRLWSWYITMEK
jgi:alpha-L-rhamnosidase